MRLVRTKDCQSLDEVKQLMTRPPLDEVQVSQASLERTTQVFGEPLTPVESVNRIIQDIKKDGNRGLLKYIELFDGVALAENQLFATEEEFVAAEQAVSERFKEALQFSIDNVWRFHEKQLQNSWFSTEADGVILGQKVTSLDRVGIYVPGGNAPLVSSVVMCAIPAKVAGVPEIVMATPLRNGKIDPHLLVAAKACGVTTVLKAGGAHGIAALAYGTESLRAVDKIVGAGNVYVTLAKKMVFGTVGIDSIAGPSEILIVADETAPAKYIAADLLSQAEHDWEAAVCLITTSEKLAHEVLVEIEEQLATLSTAEIARSALDTWGLIVVTRDEQESIELANIFAAEHLELMVKDPWTMMGKIRHAGAIFLGKYSSEPIGDYVAGPNHVLPTNGTARFLSPLSTNDFLKTSSIISFSVDGFLKHGPHAVEIADREGLEAHGNAIRVRLDDLKAGEQNE